MPAPTPDPWPWQLDGGAWRFLLPARPIERLLCYDNLGGATLPFAARLASETVVIHHDEQELDRLRALAVNADLRGVRFARLPKKRDARDLDLASGFDAVVVHDPEARTLRRDHGRGPSLDELCAYAFAVLRPGGLVYLGFRNRFSYRRMRGSKGPSPRLYSVRAVTDALQRAGFSVRPPQPFLIEDSRVTELVGDRYRSAKNPFLAAERVREIVLRGWGSRHLAPAYGVVALRGPIEPSRLEHVIGDSWVRSLAPGSALRRCVVPQGLQLMLSLGATRARHGSVVLTVNAEARRPERRRAENEWLRRLARLPPDVASVIPLLLGEREIAGLAISAVSERPGMTVDRPVHFLPELTANAARWLRDFHRATARLVAIDDAAFDRAFGRFFDRARHRHPAPAAELTRLEDRLRARLLGRTLTLAWLHGDFKIENAVFDERTRNLTGVIDWDLASEAGPPLVDLLYLLLYNRTIRQETEVLAGYAATVLRAEWTREERALIDAHREALGDAGDIGAATGAAFLVHHIGLRVTYEAEDTAAHAALRTLLVALADRLSAGAA